MLVNYRRLAALLPVLLCCACAPTVLKQGIPVSTNPTGATITADGKESCVSPCKVDLERNQDHILTVQKDGYMQQDVMIRAEYQTANALLSAINSGFGAGSFHKSVAMGVQSGMGNKEYQDATGENYQLVPSAVSLKLVPKGGFPSRATEADVVKSENSGLSPLDVLAGQDAEMLEDALETTATGQTAAWTNESTKTSFAVIPEEATQDKGRVVRWFTLGARKGQNKVAGRYPAYRAGRGEWEVGVIPAQTPDQPAAAKSDTKQVLRALGDLSWPKAGKTWDSTVSSSSNTTTTSSGPGQTMTTTSSSKTKVGVGVSASPGAVIKVLDALGALGD